MTPNEFKGFYFTQKGTSLLIKIVEREKIRVMEDMNLASHLGHTQKEKELSEIENELLGIEKELERSYSFNYLDNRQASCQNP